MMTYVLLFWVLPSLISLLFMISMSRYEKKPLETMDVGDFLLGLDICVIYPVLWAALFFIFVFPFTAKERSLFWFLEDKA